MQIMVIGATGEIGNAVTRAALERGHDVTAFVRSPEKLGSLRDRVRVVVGDLADADAVAAAVAGHDAVVSALGSSPDASQLDVPATAMRHILAGMRAGGIRRLVGLAGSARRSPGCASRVAMCVPPWSSWPRATTGFGARPTSHGRAEEPPPDSCRGLAGIGAMILAR
jgi:putative NADH-flavin reductase